MGRAVIWVYSKMNVRRTQASRGVSLGGTLIAVAVLSLLAFTLTGLSVTHLRLSTQQDRGVLASNAARSAISAAISKILQNPDFGKDRGAEDVVRIETPQALGVVTFLEDDTSYSTNNLKGTEDVPGVGGSLVPSSTVHLLAVGRSGGTERRIEAVLRLPPFPWAIASNGEIVTRNGVLVAALPEDATWPPSTEISDLLPADLVANGNDSSAIVLGNDSTILGDLETPGQVVLGASKVDVRGEIRSGSAPVELPILRASDYDPLTTGATHFSLSQGDATEIVGSARAAGNISFPQTLKLSNASLFVDGDLTLQRGVEGTGMLVATGDITIRSGARLEGLTELAVVSGGQVKLLGSGAERSVVRGFFYAEGGLEAAEITLVGSLLTGSASTGVSLDQVNVLYEVQRITRVENTKISDQTLYIGETITRRDGTVHIATREIHEPIKRVPPTGGQGAVFVVRVVPTDSGYPLTLTFTSEYFRMSQTLVIDTKEDFENSKINSLLSPFASLNEGGGSWMTMIKDAQIRDFIEGNESVATPGESSVTLFGDISRFLPMEDRIRIVSWIES